MVLTFSPQIAFLGRALVSSVGMLEKELKEKVQKVKDLSEELARVKEANIELESLQEKFGNLSLETEKLKTKSAALKKVKEEVDTANDQQAKSLKLAKEALDED
ncbi:LysM peptidoglycan-binding domain-containing protein [Sesbania bispinosa]|nr:LysM peptidoglycan-binding domain-containing protein [Sesbania bispinosa]